MDDEGETRARGADLIERRLFERRNLTLRGGVIYYKRVVAGRQIKFSCETRDWREAAAVRDLYEQRKGISKLPHVAEAGGSVPSGLVGSGLGIDHASGEATVFQQDETHHKPSRRLGSVIARGPQKWLVRLARGRRIDGKRRYESMTIRGSRRDAERVLASMILGDSPLPESWQQDGDGLDSRPERLRRAPNDIGRKEFLSRAYWDSGSGGLYVALIHVSCASKELMDRHANRIKREVLERSAFEAVDVVCACCKTQRVEANNGCCERCSMNFVTKVGFSQNVERRMQTLKPLRWGYVPLKSQQAAKAVEASVHAILGEYQITGEYFHPSLAWLSDRLPDYLASNGDALSSDAADRLLRLIKAEVRRF